MSQPFVPFVPDKEAILQAILQAEIPSLAKEESAGLVEGWVDTWATKDSEAWRVEAVELPFYLWLDEERTALLCGVSDLRMRDAATGEILHGEWKSTSAPKPKARWGEDSWIEDLSNGPQLAVYGLAMRQGHFLDRSWESHPRWIDGDAGDDPTLLVRACLKISPAQFWPSKAEAGVWAIKFDGATLDRTHHALLNEARAIQARRRTGALPWAYTGLQCTNKFGRKCHAFDKCKLGEYPPMHERERFSFSDPGGQVLVHAAQRYPVEFQSPDLVVLSASAYGDAQQCAELYRQQNLTGAEKEESYALDVGTGMHAGCAALYKQIMSWQQK